LFTLHVLPNPRSRFQLIYEYVWSELQGPNGEYAALFFRKPTNSTSLPYKEVVPEFYQDAKLRGQELTMFTGTKLVPLFSKDYFEDFFGDPNGSDYEFMYPESKWSKYGLNWGNAAVTESEVRTSNGFIYFLDQVVPPQKSIEEYLREHRDKFGLYYDILQRFANYSNTRTVNNQIQYAKSYNSIVSNIAEEQGAFTGNEVRMKDMFTAFLPNNEVLQKYLDEKVLTTYSSIDSVPKVTLAYILQTQLSRSLGLISKISKSYFNSFGDPMIITKDDILSAHMASNGVIYETKKVLEPNVFTCVPGKLFFDAHYSTFLYAAYQSGMIASLSNPNSDVTLFAPNNDQMEAYGIRYEPISQTIQFRGKDKKWNTMKTLDMVMFVQDHIYQGRLDDLTGERFIEMASKNFIRIKNGGIQAAENQRYREFATMAETIPNDKNGILYNITTPIKSNYGMGKFIVQDPEISQFKDLLVSTGFLVPKFLDQITRDTIPNLKFLAEGDYWTALIPTNAAMDQAKAAGLIPTDKEELKKFVLGHFIRKNVIFDDGKLNGNFPTNRTYTTPEGTTEYVTVKITNTLNNMTIEDHSQQVINVDHAKADYLVKKGVIHKINSILKY
ncbi:MAG: fasciclin domain-containing protein, partial [Methylococcaceae bacterium]